ITKIGKNGTRANTLLTQMQNDVNKSKQFASMLEQLKSTGVDSSLIAQVAQAGITGGGMWTADTLLKATPAQIAQLNALQKQLTDTAAKAGQSAAEGAYGAGLAAAQGIVDR